MSLAFAHCYNPICLITKSTAGVSIRLVFISVLTFPNGIHDCELILASRERFLITREILLIYSK